jgi:hypothetical protein
MKKQEYLIYTKTLKEIIDRHYEKETVFYEDGVWYSRHHGRNITAEELSGFALEITAIDE